jgi:hypothetical protein
VEPFEKEEWWVDEVVGDGMGWIDYRASDVANNTLVKGGYRGKALRVKVPAYQRRGSGAHHLLRIGLEEAWFRYHIRLDDWNVNQVGKLPGFADVGATTARGCYPSTTSDPGWSARVQFSPPGTVGATGDDIRLGYYTYHLDQPGLCGELMPWNDAGIVEQKRWYCIEGHVRMNTPGVNDGVLEAWVDGTKVFSRSDLAYRRLGERPRVKLRSMWLNVYVGGDTIANVGNHQLKLDQLVVRDSKRIGCLTRFTDDDGNPHEPDIEYLWNRSLVHGCAQNLYCPDRELTRAEMLALIDRHTRPPATERDFFTDDNGHWAEGVINRLAAAGVVKGCTPRKVCPNATVTRGQIAAFLRRTFTLPDADANPFEDTADSVFVKDISAIAETGITKGCSPTRFCPDNVGRRDQIATLFARAVRWSER